MKNYIIMLIFLGIVILTDESFSNTIYPDNEKGKFEDFLTPGYYIATNGDVLRNEINEFVHFVRLEEFQHPLTDSMGLMPQYSTPINGKFGAAKGPNGKPVQHHPAIDLHILNKETKVNIYAAHSGYVTIYKDSPKYRHYISISKNIIDSTGKIIGKVRTLYAHIDLDLDLLDNIKIEGKYVEKGALISKNLYSATVGGPHLHFEIRYYRANDDGSEDFYGFVGANGSEILTEPSTGNWEYGFWNPNIGYGYGNPKNHLSNSSSSILKDNFNNIIVSPNPVQDIIKINLFNNYSNITITIFSVNGILLEYKEFDSLYETTYDFSMYNKGIYFMMIYNTINNNKSIIKIIKE